MVQGPAPGVAGIHAPSLNSWRSASRRLLSHDLLDEVVDVVGLIEGHIAVTLDRFDEHPDIRF